MKKIIIILAVIIVLIVVLIIGSVYLYPNQKKVSECEKYGGKENNLTECNGEINKICALPNGETCYLENFRDGKCKGIFSPKVLCDKNQ